MDGVDKYAFLLFLTFSKCLIASNYYYRVDIFCRYFSTLRSCYMFNWRALLFYIVQNIYVTTVINI